MPRDELDAFGRLYLNYGLLSTWDGAITMLAGSGVGGGTLVNWMTCLDAPADVRSEWARDHGLDGLDGPEWAADVAIEQIGVAPASHPSKDERPRFGAGGAGLGGEHHPAERHRLRRPDRVRSDAARDEAIGPSGAPCRGGRAGAVVLDRARVRSLLLGRTAPNRRRRAPSRRGDPGAGPGGGTEEPLAANPRFFIATAPQVVLAAEVLRSPSILQASRARTRDRALPADPPGLGCRRPDARPGRHVAGHDAGRPVAPSSATTFRVGAAT